jgi:RNase P subunit RPR2
MTLRPDLYAEQLTHFCDHCGHKLVKPGSWFAALKGSFICDACGKPNRFRYEQKQRLFEAHAKALLEIKKTID